MAKFRAIVFFIIWNAVISLAVLEIFLHFYLPGPMFHKMRVLDCEKNEYTMSENSILMYEPKPNRGEFNKDGYRGRLFSVKKPQGKKRIVVLGDSVAEGLGVAPKKRFTELLQEYLGDGYEVINLAVRGYNIEQELEYLKVKALKYEPDLVIVGITENDLDLASGEANDMLKNLNKLRGKNGAAFYRYYYSSMHGLDAYLLKFNTYRYIKYLEYYFQMNKVEGPAGWANPGIRDHLDDIIKEMKAIAENEGFDLSFTFFPVSWHGRYPAEFTGPEPMETIKKVVDQHGIRYLDINQYFDLNLDLSKKRELFDKKDKIHLSVLGHSFCAKFIYNNFDQLTQQGH